MSIKASLPEAPLKSAYCTRGLHLVQAVCPDAFGVPCSPPYSGNLVESLVEIAERVGADRPGKQNRVHVLKPELVRDYLRLTVIPPETELHCSNVDCERTARVLIDARDQDVLAFCKDCAYVEFSHWMVGV